MKLTKLGAIGADPDYGRRLIRVLSVPDLPADGIACCADPTCYVSHLSAMQRWGLTDREPYALMLTRPGRKRAAAMMRACMAQVAGEAEANHPVPWKLVGHPARVRQRPVRVHESKAAGECVASREDGIAVSTIGQTFLDTLQQPRLCGGMAHVLEVWEEHAATYLEEIVTAVDTASIGLAKSRAGYILEERVGLRHQGIERWKVYAQRGGSCKLDPAAGFSPTFSETWMLSVNV